MKQPFQRCLALALSICAVLSALSGAQAMSEQAQTPIPDGTETDTPEEVNEAALQGRISDLPDRVTLYVIEDAYADRLTLPDGYSDGYACNVAGADYQILEGSSVTVTPDGRIAPACATVYGTGGEGSGRTYTCGSSTVLVTCGGERHTITAEVYSYAQVCARQVMDDYLREKITPGMTDMEKLRVIAAFPAQYAYSVRSSDYMGLILGDGGDCWASTAAILYLCERCGLQAHPRFAGNDGETGSGGRNAAVRIGEQVYVVDAGYQGAVPRYYSIVEENTGFCYREKDGCATVVQYDGFDSDIVVPAQLDGYPVTGLGGNAFLYGERCSGVTVNSVTLPDSLRTLDMGALSNLEHLTTVTIPAGVTSVGARAFAGCSSLREIRVAEGSQTFCDIDGVLCDRERKTLVAYPAAGADGYAVPDGIETVAAYAFAFTGIKTLFLPESVKRVGEGAFGDSPLSCLTCAGDMPELETLAFYHLNLTVAYPEENGTWQAAETLGEKALGAERVMWQPGSVKGTGLLREQTLTGARFHSKTYGAPVFHLDMEGQDQAVIRYLSHNPEVATVTEGGAVTVCGVGRAVITAEAAPTDRYLSASAEITVEVSPRSISECTAFFNCLGDIPCGGVDYDKYVTLLDGGRELSPGVDYQRDSVSYNGTGNRLTALHYSVSGRGNYTGSHTFRLTPHTGSPVLKSALRKGRKVTLTWQKEPGATGYLIYRRIGGGSAELIQTVSNGADTWTDSLPGGCTDPVTYCIRLYLNRDGRQLTSGASAGKTVYCLAVPGVNGAQNGAGGVRITWGKVAGAAKYRVFYRTGKGGWVKAGDTTGNTLLWKRAKSGTVYRFTVRCLSKDGKRYTSDYNRSGKAVTYAAVPVLSAASAGKRTVTLKWKRTAGVTGYQLQYSYSRKFAGGSRAVTVKGANTLSRTVSALTRGRVCYFRIRSYRRQGGKNYYSAWSAARAVKVK